MHAQRLITMSYGGYEARVGTPKLLELLDQLDLKATFFVTGWSVDAHPAMAESILKAGHEIGHHGYHHLLPDPGDPWIEEELERGFEALKRRLGVKPTGYRAPYGEFTEELRVALVRHGIVYTSSFRDDVRPYRHRLADGKPGTIELPVTASYDDWMHGLSARFSPRSIFPKEHVLSMWKDELDEVRDWGAMVTTVLHPQCSGRPMRLRLLREFSLTPSRVPTSGSRPARRSRKTFCATKSATVEHCHGPSSHPRHQPQLLGVGDGGDRRRGRAAAYRRRA